MCRLFIGADSNLWHSVTRSMRIDKMSTSVRLEQFFWNILEKIAKRDDMSLAQLIAKLYNESLEEGHDIDNFASFLRVCSARYLSLQLSGDIPENIDIPISSLDAENILVREKVQNTSLRTANNQQIKADKQVIKQIHA